MRLELMQLLGNCLSSTKVVSTLTRLIQVCAEQNLPFLMVANNFTIRLGGERVCPDRSHHCCQIWAGNDHLSVGDCSCYTTRSL